jgi:hypothetical protein
MVPRQSPGVTRRGGEDGPGQGGTVHDSERRPGRVAWLGKPGAHHTKPTRCRVSQAGLASLARPRGGLPVGPHGNDFNKPAGPLR